MLNQSPLTRICVYLTRRGIRTQITTTTDPMVEDDEINFPDFPRLTLQVGSECGGSPYISLSDLRPDGLMEELFLSDTSGPRDLRRLVVRLMAWVLANTPKPVEG